VTRTALAECAASALKVDSVHVLDVSEDKPTSSSFRWTAPTCQEFTGSSRIPLGTRARISSQQATNSSIGVQKSGMQRSSSSGSVAGFNRRGVQSPRVLNKGDSNVLSNVQSPFRSSSFGKIPKTSQLVASGSRNDAKAQSCVGENDGINVSLSKRSLSSGRLTASVSSASKPKSLPCDGSMPIASRQDVTVVNRYYDDASLSASVSQGITLVGDYTVFKTDCGIPREVPPLNSAREVPPLSSVISSSPTHEKNTPAAVTSTGDKVDGPILVPIRKPRQAVSKNDAISCSYPSVCERSEDITCVAPEPRLSLSIDDGVRADAALPVRPDGAPFRYTESALQTLSHWPSAVVHERSQAFARYDSADMPMHTSIHHQADNLARYDSADMPMDTSIHHQADNRSTYDIRLPQSVESQFLYNF
jgi:hypothetical protein